VNGECEPRKEKPRRENEDDYWREGDQECKRWRGPDGKWEQECWKSDDDFKGEGKEIFSATIDYMNEEEAASFYLEEIDNGMAGTIAVGDEEASLWVGEGENGGMEAEMEIADTIVTVE
jgi:hypothetical protein